MSSLLVFNRLEIQSATLVFSTPLVNCCPSTFSLTSPTPPPLPKVSVQHLQIQTVCAWGRGEIGVFIVPSSMLLVLLTTGKKLCNYLIHFSIILTNTMKILELNVFEKTQIILEAKYLLFLTLFLTSLVLLLELFNPPSIPHPHTHSTPPHPRDKMNSLCPANHPPPPSQGEGEGGGRGGPLEGVDLENHIKLTTYVYSTDNRMQNTAASKTHVHKITNVHFLYGA
jgi:hypothetical protein